MNRRHRNRDALWRASGLSFLAWADGPAEAKRPPANPLAPAQSAAQTAFAGTNGEAVQG